MKRLSYILAFLLLFTSFAYAQNEVKTTNEGGIKIEAAYDATALTLDAAEGQTGDLLQARDFSDAVKARITKGGKIQSESGMRGVANDWGDSLSGWAHGTFTAEHTISNSAGSFDATGNANGEKCFTDTTNSPFTSTDVTNKNWIVISGGSVPGAKAEIVDYIDADNVLLHAHGACWDEDLSSQNYKIYKGPQFIVGDCYDTHLHVNGDGQFHIEATSGAYTGVVMVEIQNTVGADNTDSMHIHHDAGGYNNSDAFQIFYETGDLQANEQAQTLQISIDETEATAGSINGLLIETTNASSATKNAIQVGVGFDNALEVSGGAPIDPDYGYELSTGGTVATDRVNGGAGDGNAFLEAGNDLTIFDVVNDWIIFGNDDTFEVLEVILSIVSSKDCVLEFYYTSDGAGTWSALPGVDDGTQGFTKSGLIDWTAPGDWAEEDATDDGDAITEGYYVGIKRTYTPIIAPDLPVEDYFKIYLEQAGNTEMAVRGDGTIQPAYLADVDASNNSIYYSTDQSKLVFKDPGGVVRDLY